MTKTIIMRPLAIAMLFCLYGAEVIAYGSGIKKHGHIREMRLAATSPLIA